MFRITQIDHIVLRVKDLPAMLNFYRDALGCEVERVEEDIGLYQLRAGDALLDLIPVDGVLGSQGGSAPSVEGRNLDHFCLKLDPFDLAMLKTHFAQFDITVSDPATRYGTAGYGTSVYIEDPEGNVVELNGSAED